MSKKYGLYKPLLSILLGVFLVAGLTSIGFSGGEPPAGSKTTGKAINAVITAVKIGTSQYQWVEQVLVGDCDGADFALGPGVDEFISTVGFADRTADDFDNVLLEDVSIPGCDFSGDLVISRVVDFYNTGEVLGAVVILHRLQP